MNKFIVFVFTFLICKNLNAQNIISGYIYDIDSKESLIGANVVVNEKKTGTVTNYNGFFKLNLPSGIFNLTISYVGYKPVNKRIEVRESKSIDFFLETEILDEIFLISDFARSRETPVAFSNISPKQIEEELANQDIPLILNNTPGVYATQSGGGDGDARISIRGFNQRNIAVLIDGVPVNDMENGWVYWSNWFGLDIMTKTIQVQRGLGASKLAIPAVGGTLNILTKGVDNVKKTIFSENIGNNGLLRTTIGHNSGKLKNGWGYSIAGSYKRGNGWVDQTWTEGFFYYLKLEKKIKNHKISISAFGAPQQHGQRSYKKEIVLYDKSYAAGLGIDTTNVIGDFGLRYNEHWGELNRYTVIFDENDNPIDTLFRENEKINSKKNYYHKPQISLNHFWSKSDKLIISNVIYASFGSGGGTGITPSVTEESGGFDQNRQINFQSIFDNNSGNTRHPFFGDFSIDPLYSLTEHKSTQILRSSINNHKWFGLLTTYNYEFNENYTLSGGIDLRKYTGEHYREVYDLLGGDYFVSNEIAAVDSNNILRKGDKFAYHNDGLVKWGGVFQQVEFDNTNWSAFVSFSLSSSGYKRIDYFKPLDLVLEDTTFNQILSIGDTFIYNNDSYTTESKEARFAQTDWKWIPAFTFKYGFNYNINEFHNFFMNSGFLTKAPRFNNVYDFDNSLFENIKNEQIAAIELGHSYHSDKFTTNLNLYNTQWKNRPQSGSTILDGDFVNYNINGIDALHQGIEFDFVMRFSKKYELEFLSSIGNWKWTSGDSIRSYDQNNNLLAVDYFDATGVHVGDAAQLQIGSSFKFKPNKNSYLKLRFMRFANHYSDFNPFDLKGENAGRDSWKTPAYGLFDLHAGYSLKIRRTLIDFKFNILNLLNTIYITDALNNDAYIPGNEFNFDASSASVFFGMGRRFSTSIKISF